MSSIHSNYEYDIFISYRQNDNKRDKWVTNFVEALKEELEATLKNPVSIYFDENPHDGLLDTHQVGASLEKKLKCLIFIPIISQTYCDPNSFAWKHELLPFIEMGKADELGMNITLQNGNVTKRVLPVRIHDIEEVDQQLFESAIDGSMRAIDFVYKEAGVNRPLKPLVDDRDSNEYHTVFRNQINKVANAIKEISTSFSKRPDEEKAELKVRTNKPRVNTIYIKGFYTGLVIIAIVVLAYWSYYNFRRAKTTDNVEESVEKMSLAVLPFSNTKPDPETDYLGFAIANQVIGELAYLEDITVLPSASIRKYANHLLDPIAVGSELSVNYVLIGNYLNEKDSIRLTVELVEVNSNKMIWREAIEVDFNSAFDLQDIVSKKVLSGLGVYYSPKELSKIIVDIPNNPLAYEYYLRSISYPLSNLGDRLAIEMLNKSIEIDSNYAPAYSHLALRTQLLDEFALSGSGEKKISEKYYLKALSLNENLLTAQGDLAMLFVETGRTEEAVNLARKMVNINANNSEAHFALSYIYRYGGMLEESVIELEKAIALNPTNLRFRRLGLVYLYTGEYEKAIKVFEIDSGSAYSLIWQSNMLIRQGKNKEAMILLNRVLAMEDEDMWGLIATAAKSFIEGEIDNGLEALYKLEQRDLADGEAWHVWASYYGMLGNRDGAIRSLRKAINTGFFCYPFLVKDSLLSFMTDDLEFQELLALSKKKHEEFKEIFFK